MASFKKHNTGWEYRLKYKDSFTQLFKEKSQRGFATKKEAQLAAIDFEKKLTEGYEQTDIQLTEYLDTWIADYKTGTVRKNTIELHKNNIKNHVKPYFKKIMLKEIKPDMYQKFLNHLMTKKKAKGDGNLSKRTIELIHSTMHNAMSKAVTIRKIENNPCVGVEIKGEKKKKKIKFIDSDDVPKFLKTAYQEGYIYWIFFKLLIETGIRKGEAAALKWTDIDLKNKTIVIDETLDFQPDNEDELFGDTKTYRSERTINISKRLVNDLRFHMNWQNQNKLILGNELYKHKLNLVLCRNNGNYMPKSTLFNVFLRILKGTDLPELPIHSTRHTCAVLMLEAGADMKYVQEHLGHGSIEITSDVYAHISQKLSKRNNDKIENYMDNILK